MKLRDRNRSIIYAEKLVISDEDSIDALTNLITMLRERKAEARLQRTLIINHEPRISKKRRPQREPPFA